MSNKEAQPLNWQITTLENGLRVITVHRPGTRTVAARVYVRAGSRYDGPHPGLAHFLEHMLFKGTPTRSPREIFAAIEARGGEINGATTREYTSFRTVTLARDLDLALELLADVVIRPVLAEDAFLNEKLVVLQEILRAKDQPGVLNDLFVQALWHEHPLRNPVLGTLEGLRDLQLETLRAFYRERYVAGNALLVICGDVEPETALSLALRPAQGTALRRAQGMAQTTFADFPPGPEQPPELVEEPPLAECRAAHLEKDINRTYLLIGVPTVGMKHPDRSPLKAVELALGMGGSGRLYQRLREEQGLVYSVNTVTANYEDAGFLGVRAACSPENVEAVREAILAEWDALRQEGLGERELEAVRGNYAGTLARRFETNVAVAGIFGIEGLLYRVEPFDEAVARMEAVTQAQVLDGAQRYLDCERYVLATVGRGSTGQE
jgi:predicted Zn-dependent peptidase